MVLLIDTTGRHQINLALIDGQEDWQVNSDGAAQDLPKLFGQLLEEAGIKPKQLTVIAVLTGPGSYTGTRIGTAAANLLSSQLKLKLSTISGTDFLSAVAVCRQSDQLKAVELAKAQYLASGISS